MARLVSSPSLANGALGLQCVDFCVNTPVSVTSDTDPSDVDQRSSSEAAASTDTVLPTPLIEPGRVLRNDSAEVEPDNTADLRTEETPNQTTEETPNHIADHRTEETVEQKSSEQEQPDNIASVSRTSDTSYSGPASTSYPASLAPSNGF